MPPIFTSKLIEELHIPDCLVREQQENKISDTSRIREVIIDFLNLIFGEDTDSTVFWDKILLPKM